MFATRQIGGIYTSIRLHPIKLLILAAALLLIGVVMVWSCTPWAVAGILVVLLGARLAYIGIRQLTRGARTFLS